MPKHTEGPWMVGGTLLSNGKQAIARLLWNDDRYPQANDYDRDAPTNINEVKANARLIASAPELLEACKYAFKNLKP